MHKAVILDAEGVAIQLSPILGEELCQVQEALEQRRRKWGDTAPAALLE